MKANQEQIVLYLHQKPVSFRKQNVSNSYQLALFFLAYIQQRYDYICLMVLLSLEIPTRRHERS